MTEYSQSKYSVTTFYLRILSAVIVLNLNAWSQISWEFEFSPLYRLQTSDKTELELPFRAATAGLIYTKGDLELHVSGDLQTRWQTPDSTEAGLRELYLHAYPTFGEVKAGYQILAWGYADQNNPTDNINPYNYYYMFGVGVERKEAVLALSATVNSGDMSLQGVVSRHRENVFPYDEADFPIQLPPEADPRGRTAEPDMPLEYGLRLRFPLLGMDLSASWWSGYDKTATPVLLSFTPPDFVMSTDIIRFGYRRTDVVGLDGVGFVGDMTIRAEAAWFSTENDYETDARYNILLSSEVQYLQYILQLEYDLPLDLSFSGQYMGHRMLHAEGIPLSSVQPALMTALMSGTPLILESDDIADEYRMGLGSPLHTFLESATALSLSRYFMSDRLSLKGMGIFNLVDPGQIYSLSAEYYANDWLELDLYGSFIHSGSDDAADFFKMMEDFSHIGLGLSMKFASM